MSQLPPQPQVPAVHAVLEAGDAPTRLLLAGIERRMTELAPGQILQIDSAGRNARADILAWCHVTGHRLVALIADGEMEQFWIRKRSH